MDIEQEFLEDTLNQENYSRKDPESFKDIVMRAMEKCRIEMSKELTIGSTDLKEHQGVIVPIIISDQRKVVENCINVLHSLMKYYFDDQAREVFKKIEEKIINLDQTYLDYYIKHEKWTPHRESAESNGIIPKESSFGSTLLQKKGNERSTLYWQKFDELVELYLRKNELKNKKTAKT